MNGRKHLVFIAINCFGKIGYFLKQMSKIPFTVLSCKQFSKVLKHYVSISCSINCVTNFSDYLITSESLSVFIVILWGIRFSGSADYKLMFNSMLDIKRNIYITLQKWAVKVFGFTKKTYDWFCEIIFELLAW